MGWSAQGTRLGILLKTGQIGVLGQKKEKCIDEALRMDTIHAIITYDSGNKKENVGMYRGNGTFQLTEVSDVSTEHKDTKAQRQLHCHGKRVITPKVFSLINLRDFVSLCSVNRSVLAGDAFVAKRRQNFRNLN